MSAERLLQMMVRARLGPTDADLAEWEDECRDLEFVIALMVDPPRKAA